MTASDTAPKLRVSGLSIGLIVLAIAIQICDVWLVQLPIRKHFANDVEWTAGLE